MSTVSDELASVTIALPVRQVEALHELAGRQHLSMDALIQRSIEQMLADSDDDDDPLRLLIGMVTEGPTDLSKRHGEHFAEKIHWREP